MILYDKHIQYGTTKSLNRNIIQHRKMFIHNKENALKLCVKENQIVSFEIMEQ